MKSIAAAGALLFLAIGLQAADTLTILKAGPVGEVATLAEADEVRVVFSRPMVALGTVADALTIPWFHIEPAVRGSFRWTGTDTLIFTPDRKAPLPYATRFNVTIDASARSLSGATLGKTYSFAFTTPTIQLVNVNWYRQREDGVMVIGLHFNQPVDAANIAAHLQLRTKKHEFVVPSFPETGAARLKQKDPRALQAFAAKRDIVTRASSSDGVLILASIADKWDLKRIPSGPHTAVFKTQPGIAPGTWLQVLLDETLARAPSNVRTGRPQDFVVMAPPPFFVKDLQCWGACNPDNRVAIEFVTSVHTSLVRDAVTVTDVTTTPEKVVTPAAPKAPDQEYDFGSEQHSLDELGYALQPSHRYAIRVAPTLVNDDGEPLGYTWEKVIQFEYRSAFTGFGDGNGVWESDGGSVLPFYARNFRNVKQWMAPLSIEQVVPAIAKLEKDQYRTAPPVPAQTRTLSPVPDKTQSYGLDIRSLLNPQGHGMAWVAVQNGDPIPLSRVYEQPPTRATIVQVTNLAISVKDSPQNTLVLVTRLDTGAPVSGARVSIRSMENKTVWSGATDATGIAVAPETDLRYIEPAKQANDEEDSGWVNGWQALHRVRFVVFAEREGDVAYTVSNWTEGITPFDFELNYNLAEGRPLLRGTIFTDRGVYKLGEEVHAKAILRSDTPDGMKLLPAGSKIEVVVRDSHNTEVDKRTLSLSEWSSADWTIRIPAGAPLGVYHIVGSTGGHSAGRPHGRRARNREVTGEFLVAAYRRPEFRVDVTLTAPAAIAGTKLDGRATGKYLYGGAMAQQQARWTYTALDLHDVPPKIEERWPASRYTFLGEEYGYLAEREPRRLASGEVKLDKSGAVALELRTEIGGHRPIRYQLEAEVTDVSRQKIAGRAAFRVEPAPWFIGIRNVPYFAEAKKGFDTDFVAVDMNGSAVAGVAVSVELKRIQWISVRRAEGHGFYTWDTERKVVPAGSWTVTTQSEPVPLHVPIPEGGVYELVASAEDEAKHQAQTVTVFYASGEGYTAWERYDHNRIDLVSDRQTYHPGETATVIVKSPWETATALLTTEREGVRTWREFPLTSTQQSLSIPITEKDIPNVYVSVLLVKGRTKEAIPDDDSDPGKPAMRLGYLELKVDDALKRLNVDVKADRDEYRPAKKARIEVNVRDSQGKGTQAEVTLWAVDYGVLSLTAYTTPDLLPSVYIDKALQVATADSRLKIISRRVLTPKGAADGGGGGRDPGAGTLRKDFRVLAFWVGSLVTAKDGHAQTEITLPESLTTYRIMAVAADQSSRFGKAQSEIRINKPVMLTPAFPRFLSVGDKALFGAVIRSQLKKGGRATVTIRSLDPSVVEITGNGQANVEVAPNGSVEARFDAVARSVGSARIQMKVTLNRETDAFEDTVPVRVLVAPETVAAYGTAGAPPAPAGRSVQTEQLRIPSDVVPGFGGMHVELSSTAMAGLGEGARFLVEYPYGCAEQRSSAALGLMLAADLGDAFKLPGLDAAAARAAAQTTITDLKSFQCDDGAFAFWKGECRMKWPYLTAWVAHVLQRAEKLGYIVDRKVLAAAYGYLESSLSANKPENERYWPSYVANESFAVKVLAEGGRNEDSHITRLVSYADRMPVFALSHLADALIARNDHGPRLQELQRRIANAILPEGGSAHVEERHDDDLIWYWNSNVRSTAMVAGTLVRGGQDRELVTRLVRWLMNVRQNGRWGNTQENAWVLESLVDYYRTYETDIPDFTARVTAGSSAIAQETFKGRSAELKTRDLAMPEVLRMAPPDSEVPLNFERDGTGVLFYATRLRYARSSAALKMLDQGISIERVYTLHESTSPATSFNAGDLIDVTLRIRNSKERRFVAVTDPVPAGTEPVEAWFATTAEALAHEQSKNDRSTYTWLGGFWQHRGFDFVERHDDRVALFATRLSEGESVYMYLLRATTAGTFVTAPAHAEEMYEPEVFGRTDSVVFEVKR